MAFWGGALLALRPVFAKEILGVGARGLGWLGTCSGAGAFIGAITLAGLGGRVKWMGLAVVVGQMNWMIVEIIYSFSRSYPLNLGLEVIGGASIPFGSALTIAIIQIRVPQEYRNRVLAVYFMFITLLTGSGYVVGRMADGFGDRQAMLIFGCVGVGFDLLVFAFGRKLWMVGMKRYPVAVAGSPAGATA